MIISLTIIMQPFIYYLKQSGYIYFHKTYICHICYRFRRDYTQVGSDPNLDLDREVPT